MQTRISIARHDKSLESKNKGNFVELCELFSKFDLTSLV